MKVSEYKDIADSLGKFATTREKATGPVALIGVQCTKGKMKLIAGTRTAGIILDVPEAQIAEDCSYAISARPFLQGAKVLPAREEVTIEANKKGLSIVTGGGGRIDLVAELPLREAGFPKRPKRFGAKGKVASADWKRISKFFKAISAKIEVPSVQLVGNVGFATAIAPGNRPRYANIRFPAEGLDGYSMAGYLDFWVGLASLDGDGELMWGPDGIVAKTSNATVISAPYLVSKYDEKTRTAGPPREAEPWPILALDGELKNGFTVDRKDFISIVKGQAPFDEHNRITLEVDTDSLRVAPFGSDGGQTFAAKTKGKGIRSVNAEYLNGLLSAMDSKEVTLGWGAGQPAVSITAEGYGDWTILLAPAGL